MVGSVCKSCGSNGFTKVGDFFQHCGCKYISEDSQARAEPFLELAFVLIAKYLNDIDIKDFKRISDPEYNEAQKYLRQAEMLEPNNWKLWFYKGILEELNSPTFYRVEGVSSFYYFENTPF